MKSIALDRKCKEISEDASLAETRNYYRDGMCLVRVDFLLEVDAFLRRRSTTRLGALESVEEWNVDVRVT